MSDDNPGFNNPIAFDNVRLDRGAPCGTGDVNCDGSVNLTDFAAIRDNFRLTVNSRLMGDLNGDGTVNFVDFRQWKANYTGPGAASFTEFSSVPEPSTGLFLVLGLIGLLLIRQSP